MFDVVVIGRNDASNLNKVFESLHNLKNLNSIIYIDSNSKDDSISTASTYADIIYKITEEEVCSASLARNIGTQISNSEWILYLDSDMILCEDFKKWLNNSNINSELNNVDGIIGNYIMHGINEDGKVIKTEFKIRNNKEAEYLAGSSFLKRKSVLKAGNWPPKLFSTEEQDLYTRMKLQKMKILEKDINQIEHFDRDHSLTTKLKELYWPVNYKNYIGTFQGTYKATKEKNWLHFKENKRQYLTFLSTILFIVSKKKKFKIFNVSNVIISNKFSLKNIVVSYGNVFRMIFGLFEMKKIREIDNKEIKGQLIKGVISSELHFN